MKATSTVWKSGPPEEDSEIAERQTCVEPQGPSFSSCEERRRQKRRMSRKMEFQPSDKRPRPHHGSVDRSGRRSKETNVRWADECAMSSRSVTDLRRRQPDAYGEQRSRSRRSKSTRPWRNESSSSADQQKEENDEDEDDEDEEDDNGQVVEEVENHHYQDNGEGMEDDKEECQGDDDNDDQENCNKKPRGNTRDENKAEQGKGGDDRDGEEGEQTVAVGGPLQQCKFNDTSACLSIQGSKRILREKDKTQTACGLPRDLSGIKLEEAVMSISYDPTALQHTEQHPFVLTDQEYLKQLQEIEVQQEESSCSTVLHQHTVLWEEDYKYPIWTTALSGGPKPIDHSHLIPQEASAPDDLTSTLTVDLSAFFFKDSLQEQQPTQQRNQPSNQPQLEPESQQQQQQQPVSQQHEPESQQHKEESQQQQTAQLQHQPTAQLQHQPTAQQQQQPEETQAR